MGTRADLVAATSPRAVDWASSSDQLSRVLPRTFLLAGEQEDWVLRCRAAVAYAGQGAALSHLSALRCWDLPVPDQRAIDVLVQHERRPRSAAAPSFDLRVRRSRHEALSRMRLGVRVVSLERAVVESWPLLVDDAQRAPAVVAVRRRSTTPARLRHQLRAHPRLKGRRALHELLDLLEAGCHSELEIWGHQRVFHGAAFADVERQVRMVVGGRSVYLDMFDRGARLAVELDGREYHDDARRREADIARDAALAEQGVLTLRFAHRRLTGDPLGCRRQVLRVMAVRRQQLGAPTPDLGTPHHTAWADTGG